MYEKNSILLAGPAVRKNSTVAFGSSPIRIHYVDYPKRFINRINDVYDIRGLIPRNWQRQLRLPMTIAANDSTVLNCLCFAYDSVHTILTARRSAHHASMRVRK